MYVALIQNTALLVALSTLYSLGSRLRTRDGVWFRVYVGLLFGAVAVAGMMTPFHYSAGIIYDGRSIVLSMAGLFGGLTVAGISAIIAGAFRASLGGAGVWAGLATIVGCSLVGFVFRRVHGNRPDRLGIPALYALGLAAHLVMLGCQWTLLPWPTGVSVVRTIWLPVMLIYPVATVLMGLLLGTEDRRVRAEEALRESEEALRASEERFALAVQGAKDGIWDWDIKRHTLYWSPRIKEMLGYADDELDVDFHTFESRLHPDDVEPIKAAIEAHLKRREAYNVEHRLRTKSGEYRWFNVRGQALWDKDGQPIRMTGSTTDITERKRAEEKIQEQLAELRRWYRATLDREGRIIELKREVNELLLQAGRPPRYLSAVEDTESAAPARGNDAVCNAVQ